MIIGLSGYTEDAEGNKGTTSAGKDTVADLLLSQHSAAKVALADPLKRIVKEVYGFSDEQLWGPSELRNAPDFRYPRGAEEYRTAYERELQLAAATSDLKQREVHERLAVNYSCEGWLTPRHALQQLGTEWARSCYVNTWIDYGLRIARELLKETEFPPTYSYKSGLHYEANGHALVFNETGVMPPSRALIIAIPDVRFHNELRRLKELKIPIVRVRRRFRYLPYKSNHESETSLLRFDDSYFDYVLENSNLEILPEKVAKMVQVLRDRILT